MAITLPLLLPTLNCRLLFHGLRNSFSLVHATWANLENTPSERSQTCCVSPFIGNVQTGKSTDRKQLSGSQGLGEGERRLAGVSFGGDDGVLELDGGDGCTAL